MPERCSFEYQRQRCLYEAEHGGAHVVGVAVRGAASLYEVDGAAVTLLLHADYRRGQVMSDQELALLLRWSDERHAAAAERRARGSADPDA